MFHSGRKNLFVLEVNGDSMIDAHINDGDYVVVKRQRSAETGQMVVAQTEDGEATLKELQGINPDVRVVLSSGYSEIEIAERFSTRGIAGFIQKPYVAEQLIAKIRAAVA